jgi:hypothetical protein
MVALAERLRLELDSSDRKNLVGSQIIPDKSRYRKSGFDLNPHVGNRVCRELLKWLLDFGASYVRCILPPVVTLNPWWHRERFQKLELSAIIANARGSAGGERKPHRRRSPRPL